LISRRKNGKDGNVEFYNGEIEDLIKNIRRSSGLDIFIDGGAELVFKLMKRK
jgi:hypothetical protein